MADSVDEQSVCDVREDDRTGPSFPLSEQGIQGCLDYHALLRRAVTDVELMRSAMKALGQAVHLTQHNKAMCVQCRKARDRIWGILNKLEERLLQE